MGDDGNISRQIGQGQTYMRSTEIAHEGHIRAGPIKSSLYRGHCFASFHISGGEPLRHEAAHFNEKSADRMDYDKFWCA
jgi:hypothetical protein